MTRLYQYDHCPFCVKAEMVANYKHASKQTVYLLNDDEDSCFHLVGAKMVPILEVDGRAMGESLEIAKYFDQHGDPSKIVREGGNAQALLAALDSVDNAINCLLFPRNIKIGLPEFETTSAQDYFEKKKASIIGLPFNQALKQTDQYVAEVEKVLNELPNLPMPSLHQNTISWDDVHIYPTLRNLTMVAGLTFPEPVRRYIREVADLTYTHMYFDRAI